MKFTTQQSVLVFSSSGNERRLQKPQHWTGCTCCVGCFCLVAQTLSVRLPEPKEDRKAFAKRFSHSRCKRGVKIRISKCQDMIIFIANVSRKKVGCSFVQFDALGFENSFPTLNVINISCQYKYECVCWAVIFSRFIYSTYINWPLLQQERSTLSP